MSVIVFSKPRIVNNPKWTETPSKAKAINKRVEMLGDMDDRYKALRGAGDVVGLKKLADEYEKLKCPNTADQIRYEAERL